MKYEDITTDQQLEKLCKDLTGASWIAFDTEFVSERTYRPKLCLVQVAADGDILAVIDSLAVNDMTPFWEMLATGDHETIAHAGREEFLFCQRAIDKRPSQLVDIQLAAGMAGFEYPAGYGSLVSKLLRQRVAKGETRTDWERRPLTSRQIEYALADVTHLKQMWDLLSKKLAGFDRLPWFREEMIAWQDRLSDAAQQQRWRRTSGINSLSERGLAILRELWIWRDDEASRRDRPPKRMLRDDLMIEIARRGSPDVKQIGATRGMERGDLRRLLPTFSACVERALALSDDELPNRGPREKAPQLTLLCQFLTSALNSVCRSAQIAPSIVGTVADVREMAINRLNLRKEPAEEPPALSNGWRAEIVGNLFDALLSGKTAIRIGDPLSDHPLVFDNGQDGEQ